MKLLTPLTDSEATALAEMKAQLEATRHAYEQAKQTEAALEAQIATWRDEAARLEEDPRAVSFDALSRGIMLAEVADAADGKLPWHAQTVREARKAAHDTARDALGAMSPIFDRECAALVAKRAEEVLPAFDPIRRRYGAISTGYISHEAGAGDILRLAGFIDALLAGINPIEQP